MGTGSHENQGALRSQQAASLQVPVFLHWDHRVLSIAHCLGMKWRTPKSEAQGHLQLDRNFKVDLALHDPGTFSSPVESKKEKGKKGGRRLPHFEEKDGENQSKGRDRLATYIIL